MLLNNFQILCSRKVLWALLPSEPLFSSIFDILSRKAKLFHIFVETTYLPQPIQHGSHFRQCDNTCTRVWRVLLVGPAGARRCSHHLLLMIVRRNFGNDWNAILGEWQKCFLSRWIDGGEATTTGSWNRCGMVEVERPYSFIPTRWMRMVIRYLWVD